MGSFKERSVLTKNAISLVMKGQKTMNFAEKKVDANDQEIHFLSAGNCIASIDFTKQREFESILLFFDDKVLTDFFFKYQTLVENLRSKIKPRMDYYVSLKKDVFIYTYISSLELMLKNNKQLSSPMKQLKLEELLLYLLERYPQTILSFQVSPKNSHTGSNIRKVVETNITSNLTIDELAFLCNVSPSTFKRMFFKVYHKSPISWFLDQKMKVAANLLKHFEKPGDVFYKVGYENHSSFSKSFKKFYGISPRDFQMKI
jgi:AraC-like DNA-binding protein